MSDDRSPDRPGPRRGARALDRASALPLWAQMVSDLRDRVARGDFAESFPSESQLSTTYDVSRQTVREALRRLEGDGMLVRARGRSTKLSPPQLEQPLHTLYSLARNVVEHGYVEHSLVLAFEIRAVDEAAAAASLGLEPGSPALHLERLRFADDDPLALDRSWMPAELAPALQRADFSMGSIYDRLAECCGLRVTGGFERIRPSIPSPGDRRLLQLPPGEAVFAIERHVRSGERPVEWRSSLVRGDRYAFLAEWPAGAEVGHPWHPQGTPETGTPE